MFGNLTQNGEMHLGTYTGTYTPPIDPPTGSSSGGTPVPEAPGWTLFLLGIAGVLLGRRLIRKTA